MIRNFISDYLSPLIKFKSGEETKRFYETLTSAHPSVQHSYLCDMLALLDKVKLIKDPKSETEEVPIPTDLKFDKRYAMKGLKICKIQDEGEFREQAREYLREYFQEFKKEGGDVEGFC